MTTANQYKGPGNAGRNGAETRRKFLMGSTALALGAVVLAGPSRAASPGTMTRADYLRYIGIFNQGNTDAYGDYYHPEATLERGDLRLEGKQAILEFYREFHQHVDQHIDVLDFLANKDRVAVELMSSFQARSDWSHPFAGTMTKGQKRKANTFVHYNMRDGKFVLIRSARYRAYEL